MGWIQGLSRNDNVSAAQPGGASDGPADGALSLPQHPAVRAIFGAMMAAGPAAVTRGWRLESQCAVSMQRPGTQPILLRLEAGSARDAEEALLTISPLIIDVLSLLLAVGPDGAPRARLIRPADILQAKGGGRRCGQERRALEQHIAELLQILRRLSLGAGPLLFDLTPIEGGAFVFQPGAALRQLAYGAPLVRVDPKLLQLDHRTNRGPDLLAKKLGVHFALGGESIAIRNVRSLLRAVGEASPELATRIGRSGRLAERFDEALLRLEERSLFHVRYRGKPIDQRVKGWVNRWLAADLVITPWRGENAL